MKRRSFLQTLAGAALGGGLAGGSRAAGAIAVPSYLKKYAGQYAADPRGAALRWFREAKFGLFLHYGLYSLLGRHEWVQLREKIPVAEYAKLMDRFTAEKFDADRITDLALAAEMRYVNITTRHHDSFCLFATRQTDFHSANSPAKRDLVGELSAACQKKGLGLCLYYTHGRDWKHPHAPNNDEWGGRARPEYDPPEPSYAYGKNHDLQKYLDFMSAQITELLTNYGPIAAIWLDGIGVPLTGDRAKFKCQELYDLVHRLQPQVLVSYKQGLLGTEDFFAPEHKAVENPSGKPMEICSTLQEKSWGYNTQARHISTDEAWDKLSTAGAVPANLLLNSGPLPDGAIPPEQAQVLQEMGQRIRAQGYPAKHVPSEAPLSRKNKNEKRAE
ncbi:MAG: alpha-L-fucosidase [Verrucomicrobiae bacterium]|nr:alpha-L-fucosidase [Verrucomicrobiae bacterium]